MSQGRSEFERLMAELRQGSQKAAWELVERYTPKMLRVVRRRLPAMLRTKFDSLDFIQAAWASVFAQRSRLAGFERPEQLEGYLAAVARNKVGRQAQRYLAEPKRDARREQSLEQTPAAAVRDRRGATPSQVVSARERWFRLLAARSPAHRECIQLRFNGLPYREIARRLGCDESTVRRVVRRLLEEWER